MTLAVLLLFGQPTGQTRPSANRVRVRVKKNFRISNMIKQKEKEKI